MIHANCHEKSHIPEPASSSLAFFTRISLLILISLIIHGCIRSGYDPVRSLDKYNIVWTSPSANTWGTMPAGNGDISLNVWVEESGDLLFYIGKTDSWDDNCRLLKLGRVRVHLNPNPLLQSKALIQTLRLSQATIEIQAGEAEGKVVMRVWADANYPVVHVAIDGKGRLKLPPLLSCGEPNSMSFHPLKSVMSILITMCREISTFQRLSSPTQFLAVSADSPASRIASAGIIII